jgi:hypothetical protein
MAKAKRGGKASGNRRSRNGASPPPVVLGTSEAGWDEIYKRWGDKLLPLHSQLDAIQEKARTLKGQISQAYQAAEKDGCVRKGIQQFMADQKQESLEIQQRERARARMHRIYDSALHQLDLFKGVFEQPAPVNAFLAGQQAGRAAKPVESCPYEPESKEFHLWIDGHASGQALNHDSLRQASAEGAPA